MRRKGISGIFLTLFLVSIFTLVFNVTPVKAMRIDVPGDYTTIQEAIDAASYGDFIYVSAGTYEENIVMKDGIKLIGAGSQVTTIRAGGTIVVGASDALILGFTITGGKTGVYASGVSGFCILNNNITGLRTSGWDTGAKGIQISSSSMVSICRNELSDIRDSGWGYARGIDIYSCIDTTVYGNLLYDVVDDSWNHVAGIFDHSSSDSVIVGNILYNIIDNSWNHAFGIHEYGSGGTIAYNTLVYIKDYSWDNCYGIYNNGGTKVTGNIVAYVYETSGGEGYGIYNIGGTVTYNDVWGTSGGPNYYGPMGVGNLQVDPMFVDAAAYEFHLQEGSLCLTASETGEEIGVYGAPVLCIIPAILDIDPNTLNLKSNGKWVTCYIELMEGFNVEGIDRSTVFLEGTIPVDPKWVEQPLESVIGDYDEDGIPDLMVKFDRQALIEYLNGQTGEVVLTVTGEVAGILFEGTDTINIISNAKK